MRVLFTECLSLLWIGMDELGLGLWHNDGLRPSPACSGWDSSRRQKHPMHVRMAGPDGRLALVSTLKMLSRIGYEIPRIMAARANISGTHLRHVFLAH